MIIYARRVRYTNWYQYQWFVHDISNVHRVAIARKREGDKENK